MCLTPYFVLLITPSTPLSLLKSSSSSLLWSYINLFPNHHKHNIFFHLTSLSSHSLYFLLGIWWFFYQALSTSLNIKFVPCPLSSFDRKLFPFSSGEVWIFICIINLWYFGASNCSLRTLFQKYLICCHLFPWTLDPFDSFNFS